MEHSQTLPINRLPLATRLAHWIFVVSFLALGPTAGLMLFGVRNLPFSPKLVHLWFAGIAIAGALLYGFEGLAHAGFRRVFLTASDARMLFPMVAYYLRLRRTPPRYDGYNPLQKLAYTTVVFVLGPLALVTGLAIWPHAWFAHPLTQFFGGRHAARWFHTYSTLAIAFFVAGHIFMVAATGWRKNMRLMWFTRRSLEG
jgi:thiosulfate reductase cytochrome b subunit